MLLNSLTQWSLWWSCNFGATYKRNQINAIFWFCLFFTLVFQLYAKLIQVSSVQNLFIHFVHTFYAVGISHPNAYNFLSFLSFDFLCNFFRLGPLTFSRSHVLAIFTGIKYCPLQMEIINSFHMECDILYGRHNLFVHLSKILFGR